jgi:hypothetical protein
MLRLLALACLLLLAMLRLLQPSASVRFERAGSTDASVPPEAVNTGCGATFGASFQDRSEDAAAALRDGPTALRVARNESRTGFLSTLTAIRETEILQSRIGSNAEAFILPQLILSQSLTSPPSNIA